MTDTPVPDVRELAAWAVRRVVLATPDDAYPSDEEIADAVLAAVEPVIRQQVAEEIAGKIDEMVRRVARDAVIATALDRAATIARSTAKEAQTPPSPTQHPGDYDDPPCGTCGCMNHSCAADCDCCPEHGADLRQPTRVVTVQRWMALDLHIALGHLVDHEAPYQGRRSWADWWADLCSEVRGMAAAIARSHSTREEQDHG